MLRVFAFAVLFTSGFASDDHSLMQQGTAALERVSSSKVQESMRIVKDKLSEIPLHGKARQVAIDTLMSDLSSATKLTGPDVDKLNDLISLLNTLFALFQADTTSAQESLNAIIGQVAACNSASVVEVETARQDMETHRTTHKICRDQQQEKYEDEANKCGELVSFMGAAQQAGQGLCSDEVLDSQSHDQAEAWKLWFDQAKQQFTDQNEDYGKKQPPCKTAQNALSGKATSCLQDQNTFETSFCIYRQELTSMCDTRTSCVQGRIAAHETLWASQSGAADDRMHSVRLINTVICLVTHLRDTAADETQVDPAVTLERCKAESDALDLTAEYGLTDPVVTNPDQTAEAPCDRSPVASFPGEDDWYSTGSGYAVWCAKGSAGCDDGGAQPKDPNAINCEDAGPWNNNN